MPFQKTGTITGVNSGHALAANVHEIRDFGAVIKDVIADAEVTSPAAYVDDPVLGPSRLFTDANEGMDSQFPIPCGSPNYGTVLVLCRGAGTYQDGATSGTLLVEVVSSGDTFRLRYDGYSSSRQKLTERANFGTTYNLVYTTRPTSQSEYEEATCYAATYSKNPTKFYINGAEQTPSAGTPTDLGGDFANTTAPADLMPAVGTTGDHYVSAVVSFDKELSDAELASVTADPVALFDMESPPSVTLGTTTYTPGSTISGSYANFAGVPTSPLALTDSGSNTLNVTVTITDNGDGTGTFTGTMPTLPAQGNSAAGLLFGSVTAELTDPGA